MKRQIIRVIVASEYPEARAFLRRLVEIEGKTVIVGEAESGKRALTLARTLRPDVAVIDGYLPHVVGLDNVSLSRVGGLDAAQSISEEIPNVQVVLLSSLAERVLSDSTWKPEVNAFLCKEINDSCVPFTLGELHAAPEQKGPLVFANVGVKAEPPHGQRTESLGDKAVFLGALGAALGWFMILTIVFANIGIFVLLAGVVIALLGLSGRLVSRLFGKQRHSPNNRSTREDETT